MASSGNLNLIGFGVIDLPLRDAPASVDVQFLDEDRYGHGCGPTQHDFCSSEHIFVFHRGRDRHYIRIYWLVHGAGRNAVWSVS